MVWFQRQAWHILQGDWEQESREVESFLGHSSIEQHQTEASFWYSGTLFLSHSILSWLNSEYEWENLEWIFSIWRTSMKESRRSWLDRFRGYSKVHSCVRLCSFRSLEDKNKSILDSDEPLWWWKVEDPVECERRENVSQKAPQQSCLLGVDLVEQLESVPMRTLSPAEMLLRMYSVRSVIH